MRAALTLVFLLSATVAAHADCLQEIGQVREQVDAQNIARPTAQSQAAARELQKLERSESANEIDCVNTLVRARKMLASPAAPPNGDRFARDHRNQP
jgi:hypothetical protein